MSSFLHKEESGEKKLSRRNQKKEIHEQSNERIEESMHNNKLKEGNHRYNAKDAETFSKRKKG